jgi:hypothetical protein
MVSHESGSVTQYDSVFDCCNWIFERLLAGEPPEFHWRRYHDDSEDADDDDSDPPFELRIVRPDE